MPRKVNVIDLFAGPGGLGEGFSAYADRTGHSPFKIAVSIEKEASAHATLLLRAFYRQFPRGEAPVEYYQFVSGQMGRSPEEKLYTLPKFSRQIARAREEARCLTLGEDNQAINDALDAAIATGEECVLIGGPPCQAYSLAGRSRRMGDATYDPVKDGRNFLYREYLRVLAKCEPVAFIMENVKGMLSAEVGGERMFERIMDDLQHPQAKGRGHGYTIFSLVEGDDGSLPTLTPADYVVRMERFGIPQARHRVLLFGVRNDFAARWTSKHLLNVANEVTVRDVIGTLPALRSGLSRGHDSRDSWLGAIRELQPEIANVRDVAGKAVSDAVRCAIVDAADTPDDRGATFSSTQINGSLFGSMPRQLRDWYRDPAGNVLLCNHESRGHMAKDLQRYLFCSAWASVAAANDLPSPFPRPSDYPEALVPLHDNFHTGHFADRFRVQIENRFGTTVTSHIAKDGHYFIHYDPAQCRSLTVREAARIQTFPDNYFFLGNRTQQYVQVGNAVPPLLASKVASIVASLIQT